MNNFGNPQWPPGQNAQAALNPPSNAGYANQGVQWERRQAYWPEPLEPIASDIGRQYRQYVMDPVVSAAAGTEVPRRINLDIPGTIYAITANAVDQTAIGQPTGNPLNWFLLRFEHSSGDRLTTQLALASTVAGSAERPALVGGPAWKFDRGSSVRIGIQPLFANLRIDVCFWMIENRGPANYNNLG